MGRRGKSKLEVPLPSRESDVSDMDSVAISSVAADQDLGSDDETPMALHLIDILAENVENISDKRNNTRVKAMANLVAIFQKSVVDEDLEKWKSSICDALDKNLRRTDDESVLACSITGLLAIQKAFDIEEEMHPLLQTLVTLCNDYSKPEAVRSNAVHALGIASFFSSDQPAAIQTYLSALYNIWSSTKSSATSSVLFCSALESWTLLLHRAGETYATKAIEESETKLTYYLEASNVEIRMSAGEALATLFQLAKEKNDEFEFKSHYHLKNVLETLAADSLKYHAKRDKRVQRFTFRQINDVIFNDTYPETTVAFNKREKLEICDCMTRLLYDSLCQSLESHLNTHLSINPVIRDAFDLGPIAETAVLLTKAEKRERQQIQTEMTKMRKIQRTKQRDKKVL